MISNIDEAKNFIRHLLLAPDERPDKARVLAARLGRALQIQSAGDITRRILSVEHLLIESARAMEKELDDFPDLADEIENQEAS